VLHAEPGSRIYAGLNDGVDRAQLERAITNGTTPTCCTASRRRPARRVSTGRHDPRPRRRHYDFEVQQTSDTTYRLFDWDRVDAKTGQSRDLHIEQSLACADFSRGP